METVSKETTAVSGLVGDFFQVAGQVHKAASALRDEASVTDCLLLDCALTRDLQTTLAAVVERLEAVTSDPNYGDFVQACRMVGLDLLVHLGRLVGLHAAGVDAAALQHAWPEADVDGLGSRLHEMLERWKETCPSLISQSLLDSLARLKVDIADAVNKSQQKKDLWAETQAATEVAKEVKQPLDGLFDDKLTGAKPVKSMVPMRARLAPTGLLEDFILDSLAYKSMRDREEEVTEAHSKTFEWIFAGNDAANAAGDGFNNRFMTWLTTKAGGPIYWINGKPGSGKSTLMRFLFEHDTTIRHLATWADGLPVIKAGFFFWTSGSREQRSQTGLLRYLLHQLLSANKGHIPIVFPGLWSKLLTMSTKERIQLVLDWTVPELMAAFNTFMDTALQKMAICLFIDGLDEFDGNHLEIIHFFRNLGEGQHGNRMKMCLSSRPWGVFEQAFQYSVPSLKLQDLTSSDMLTYAHDRLRRDAVVRRLLKREPGLYGDLVKETVDRADGVFLWVRLAVDKMLNKFQPGQTLADLQAVLRSLPTELDDLFAKLLFKDQTPAQIAETASLFQLIHARETVADFIKDESANSLTVWELAFALIRIDDTAALELEVVEASDDIVLNRCNTTRAHVHKRFAGLLDIFAKASSRKTTRFVGEETPAQLARAFTQNKMTYIHRTVRDWLMLAEGVRELLDAYAPDDFDPHLRLLRSYVLRLKLPLEEPEHHRRLDEWWSDIALALTHARYIRRDPGNLQRSLVNELDKTISWYWLPKKSVTGDHWARSAFGAYEVRMKATPIHEPFLCLAAKFALTTYLCEELNARDGKEAEGIDEATPLLTYATEFLCSRNKTIYPLSDPELVEYLLTHPSPLNPGPNYTYKHFITHKPITPWLALLRHMRDARRRGWVEYYDVDLQGTARWAGIVEAFVKLGQADANALVVADGWDAEITALGVQELLLETYGAYEVKGLRDLIIAEIEAVKGGRE